MLLATMAGMAFTSAQIHEDEERRAANLQAALATREMIGQAQGILMERERITPDQAFDILRRASQHLNVKLRDVAQSLVDTGERPDTGRACSRALGSHAPAGPRDRDPRGSAPTPRSGTAPVVGTGVDPVTSRFSGARSTN